MDTHNISSNFVKEISRLRQEINSVLSNVFNSIKEINRLRKKINRLLSKGMSSMYLKVTFKKIWCH